ncbi:MAG: hypothetical protein CEE38_08965 [Planctomycetes bacterium B3_Pla]|nr:MAG: hypothetical protein CEE38_08965 [Planctomycetes bacterium B3_Pla]
MRKAIFLRNAVRCVMDTAMLVVLGVGLAAGQSSLANGKAWIHPGWKQVVVDPEPLAGTIRRQIADISSLGGRRFVVAYIIEDRTDNRLGRGDLRYARFDVDAGLKSSPIGVAARADWVRAATGGPLLQGTCSLEAVTARLIQPEVRLEFGNPNYVTFFSYGLRDGDVLRAKLMRHNWCGGRFMTTHHDVGGGVKPSVAVGRHVGEIKLLVVYGRGNGLFGRFFDTAGTPIGTEFEVDTFPDGFDITSTDIIWNAVAQRFIVGFIRNGGLAGGCTVNNVRITWEGVVEEPVRRGFCDAETGGHHTAVAYDNRPSSNPDGVYAWWYEGYPESGGLYPVKALRLMDANGNPTGFEVDLVQSGLTFPVASRREKSEPLQLQLGLIPGSYVTVSTVSPFTAGEKRMAGWTFDPDGSTRMIGLVTPEHSWQVAVETLETNTVVLWRQCVSDNECSLGPWAITVFSHFRPDQRILRIRVPEKDVNEKAP